MPKCQVCNKPAQFNCIACNDSLCSQHVLRHSECTGISGAEIMRRAEAARRCRSCQKQMPHDAPMSYGVCLDCEQAMS